MKKLKIQLRAGRYASVEFKLPLGKNYPFGGLILLSVLFEETLRKYSKN